MSRRLLGDKRGVAAAEFALVAPILTAILLGIVQYGGMLIAYDQMHSGIASGALYVMRGGSDPAAAQGLALGAWPNKPSDAAITVAQSCTCAGAAAGCGALCVDGSYPQGYWAITGHGTYTGMFGSKAMTTTQTIRTQ